MLMLYWVPEWWIFVTALIKLGAVFCPAPTMLTPKDLQYRVNAGKFEFIITDTENADKVEKICRFCPTLKHRMLVDGEMQNWISYQYELFYPAPVSRSAISMPVIQKTHASDPMLIYFTSGTTVSLEMVIHSHSHPLGHIVTGTPLAGLNSNDLHFTSSDTGWAKCGWENIWSVDCRSLYLLFNDARGNLRRLNYFHLLKIRNFNICCRRLSTGCLSLLILHMISDPFVTHLAGNH